MIKKAALILCLISFIPAAAGAGELPASAVQPAEQPAAQLALKTSSLSALEGKTLLALNETQPAAEREVKRERPSCGSFGNFFDIHFGGYRWLWWAGATAVLVAIHVAH